MPIHGAEAIRVGCRVCGSSRLSPWVWGWDRFIERETRRFLVAWCAECRCGTTQVTAEGRYYEEAYTEEYFRDVLRVEGTGDRSEQLKYLGADGLRGFSVLEVGCGAGDLLTLLREHGARVRGVEPGRIPRGIAQAKGLDVVAGLAEADGSVYDVVALFDVLEHLPTPLETLRWVAGRLAPGGRVVVGVPNIESMEFRLLGVRWFALELPRHLTHFTPRALDRIAELAGLRVRQLHYPRVSYFAKSFVDDRLKDGWLAGGRGALARTVHLGLWMAERILFRLGNRPCLVAVLTPAG